MSEATTHDEVVTHARVRLLDLPDGAGRMALITIDNDRDHTRPTTFGPGGLAEIDAALDQVTAMAEASLRPTAKALTMGLGTHHRLGADGRFARSDRTCRA